MNIKNSITTVTLSATIILACSALCLAQSNNRGITLQRPSGVQIPQQRFAQPALTQPRSARGAQQQTTQYYNVNLTDAQKQQPAVGAVFYDTGNGMGVRSIFTNGPAQKAGITSGDFISKVNNQPIRNVASFDAMIAGMKAGDTIQLTKRSNAGKETEVSCQLMTMSEIMSASVVPEAGVYENAALKAEQMLKAMQQEIQNAESELADLKKRFAMQQQQLADLKSKAESEREKAKQMQAAEEAKRQMRMEELRKKAIEEANR